MTRLQLRWVATLSLLCTLVVLGRGLRQGDGADASSALVAQRRPVTIAAPGLGGEGDASPAAHRSSASSDSAPASRDRSPARSSPPSSSTPSDASGGGDGGFSGSGSGTDPRAAAPAPKPTKIRHVFLIVLAGYGFDAAFGSGSTAPYLSGTLRPQGTLLTQYRTLGRADLPDALAAIGGQPPNPSTRADCPVYREIPPSNRPSRSGEIDADGCVYPNTVVTLADQLDASRHSWKAYVEDLDRGPAPAPAPTSSPSPTPAPSPTPTPAAPKTTCRHPGSNAPDNTTAERPGDGYATRLNPFAYYHSLLDLGACDADDGALTQLDHDLASAKDTPSFSWVAPNLCDGGWVAPCLDGRPGGLAAADAFLATWVPKILASPAYRADGLLIVAFAGDVSPPADPAAPPAADAPAREGALLVSRYAQAGANAASTYDPYSLLRSLEDVFALEPLARAATAASFAPTALARAYVTPPGD